MPGFGDECPDFGDKEIKTALNREKKKGGVSCMGFFEETNGVLIFRENGETLQVEAWGENSLRVRSRMLGEISEEQSALTEPVALCGAKITIDDEYHAQIANGKIHAELAVQAWGHALQITFYNEKNQVLLREIPNGGALCLKARYYRSQPGGSFYLKASFLANEGEKIYGMGQYQQERMDLKGCNLELAHRNSQASVPFYVSSLGYGFLWNNPAVGEVHFGANTTEWEAWSTDQLDYWITAGGCLPEIEKNFSAVTGRAPIMPE